MSLNDRILVLADHGHEPHAIAALLGLTPQEVQEALKGIEVSFRTESSATLFRAVAEIQPALGEFGTAASPIDLPDTTPEEEFVDVTCTSLIVAPVAGQHTNFLLQTPKFSSGTLTANAIFLVTNHDATEYIAFGKEGLELESGVVISFNLHTFTVVGSHGEALKLREAGDVTLPEGLWLAQVNVGFHTDALKA